MIPFNLITDDWISVTPLNSNITRKVGIRELLNGAGQYRNVQGSAPLETAAMYRLLIAFIHSAYASQEPPQDISDVEKWKQTWQQRRFDKDVINRYCDDCQQRFNLFDSARPFYQDPKLTGREEPVSSLMAHVASGADATLFNHNTQANSVQLSLDQTARAVVTIQAFGLCGTKGKSAQFSDAPCARGIMFFVEGLTLFETLMLNLPDRDLRSHRLKQREKDAPAWGQSNPFASDPQRPYGLLDHLTWHNRRIRLIPPTDDSSLIAQMVYAPGLKTADAKKSVRDVFNPFHHWQAKTEDDGTSDRSDRSHSPIVFRQDKALWRDSAVLLELPSDDNKRDKPPVPLSRARTLADEGIIPYEQSYRLLAIGACTKPPRETTFFYRVESFPLPMKYLDRTQSHLVSDLSTALGDAEKTGKLLNRCAFTLAWLILETTNKDKQFDEIGDVEKESPVDTKMEIGRRAVKDGRKVNDTQAPKLYRLFESFGVERLYWSQLEAHFHRLIQDLPSDPEAAKEKWRGHLRRAANSAFQQAIAYAGTDRRAQRAIVKAEEQFQFGLARLLNIKQTDSTNGGETNVAN
jgi:CRISPR system Cascade subunit CasA